jgi:hypothetical protein
MTTGDATLDCSSPSKVKILNPGAAITRGLSLRYRASRTLYHRKKFLCRHWMQIVLAQMTLSIGLMQSGMATVKGIIGTYWIA